MSRYTQIFILIVALVIASTVVVFKMPTKRGLDLAGGVRVVLQAETDKLPEGEKWSDEHMNSVIQIVRSRVDIQGVSEPLIQSKRGAEGEYQIVVELPEIKDEAEAIRKLQSTAQMEFWHFKTVHYPHAKRYRGAAAKHTLNISEDAKGNTIYTFLDREGNEIPLETILAESELILTGNDIKPVSRATKDPSNLGTVVALEFKPEGRKTFAEFTRKNVDEILAIILDGEILSAPTINTHILDGHAIITGSFTAKEAQELAEFINAGALPVPLSVVQTQSVEATLGMDSVDDSVKAGIWGLLAIIVFMLGYYLLPGLIADIALGIYALLTFAVFKLIPVTLTLPGIAAFILSIGMAVDANILIFERLKEELRSGKTLRAAIDAGFSRAFTSIFDSNMCTLITCLILYHYGTGPIRGFALVLGIGVIISFFTAITVTRTILHLIVNTGFANNPVWFGLARQWVAGQEGRRLDLVKDMWKYFALSGLLIVGGMYLLLGMEDGIRYGIDFTGGSLTQVQFKEPVKSAGSQGLTVTDVDQVLAKSGFGGSPIQRSGDDPKTVFIRTKEVTPEQFTDIKTDLQALGGTVKSSEMIGATISKELTQNAVKAILIAVIAIVLYLSVRFAVGGLAYGFRFGICTVGALAHDVVLVVGAFAAFGHFFGWELDSLFVTALLTVIGYSVHDTIVIFDRVRENMRHRAKGESFDSLVNKSIMQSFARSINTTLTLVFTLVALLVLGSPVIRPFVAALLVGVVAGTYSSMFNASQFLALWQRLTDKQKAFGPAAADTVFAQPRSRELKPLGDTADSEEDRASSARRDPKSSSAASKKKRKRRF